MIVTNTIRIMRYPKHVLDKIMSNPKLKKRHEKEQAAQEKKGKESTAK